MMKQSSRFLLECILWKCQILNILEQVIIIDWNMADIIFHLSWFILIKKLLNTAKGDTVFWLSFLTSVAYRFYCGFLERKLVLDTFLLSYRDNLFISIFFSRAVFRLEFS